MPTIDMPLEQLGTYAGRNPKPADFDAYWARALAEMRDVDPAVEIVESGFEVPGADCLHLYFTGVGGARIHAKYVRPKHAKEPHPAVLQFHGYAHHSGDWIDKLGYAAAGFSVLAMDCRGQGGRSEDKGGAKGTTFRGHIIRGLDDHPDRLLFRDIFLDAAQLAGIAMSLPEVDAGKVGTIGGSQGGGLALACAALEPRIRRAAPSVPFLCDYKRVWEMDLARDAYEELRTYFRLFDPQHKREEEIFERLGYVDVQHLADRIRGEVMMGVGLLDTVCPPSTQFAAYNKIVAGKQMEIYHDYVHERLADFEDKALQFMLGM
ncbi:acetylxylan esterase [Cohnella ginsengisoli]|uniref:Acetylxylan esterase n=1 Tax=Cohnella ginsengisoli TaxID=425004 RepID=A0A9X4QNK2_9BACL|nr:alpha/beta fold hydrolase [Cohnella ginsengisoli]MDG0792696.1 acetylxylan esterase [Cohnella ginsengisoli]